VVAIGGSIPLGVSPEIYRKIINLVKKCQVKVVLDVDGEALRQGIKALPNVIKPNIHELSELAGRELKDLDDIVSAARSINQQGVEIVLVSMGAKGILLVSDGQQYLAVPPKVSVESTIGAGDSSVAGFIFGLVRGKDLKQCLIYAVAAGTATTLRQGTALCQKDDFERIVPEVLLTDLLEKS
jgi:6-phosphofructokinase 2